MLVEYNVERMCLLLVITLDQCGQFHYFFILPLFESVWNAHSLIRDHPDCSMQCNRSVCYCCCFLFPFCSSFYFSLIFVDCIGYMVYFGRLWLSGPDRMCFELYFIEMKLSTSLILGLEIYWFDFFLFLNGRWACKCASDAFKVRLTQFSLSVCLSSHLRFELSYDSMSHAYGLYWYSKFCV